MRIQQIIKYIINNPSSCRMWAYDLCSHKVYDKIRDNTVFNTDNGILSFDYMVETSYPWALALFLPEVESS